MDPLYGERLGPLLAGAGIVLWLAAHREHLEPTTLCELAGLVRDKPVQPGATAVLG